MKRISAALTINVPVDICFRAASTSYDDARWREAYNALRPGRRYSALLTVTEPGRRFEISLAAIDALTKARVRKLGYTVIYTFTAVDEARTTIEVAIEYTLFAAVFGLGLLKPQAENEILHRLAFMVGLEKGRDGLGSGNR